MKVTYLLLFLICINHSFGQSLQEQELALLKNFKRADYWFQKIHENSKVNAFDSLDKENNSFKKKLLKLTKSNPLSIDYPFSKLEGVTIVTSPDKKFRIYSWDLQTGGSMHFYDNIFQYKDKNKVFADSPRYVHEEGETGAWIFEVFEVNINGKNAYMAVYNIIESGRISYQKIKAFNIENQKLNPEFQLFKTGSGTLNEIDYEFDFFSVADRPERPVKLIRYSPATKILKIPVVSETGKVTRKFIYYQFTGRYFEYKYTK